MTPKIAFAIAFSLYCTATSADETTDQGSASLRPDPVFGPTLQSGISDALPVIEISAPVSIAQTIDLTTEPEELYHRMRLGFSMPNLNSSLVLHHQQWYLNHPEYLRRMVERSSRYLHHIIEEIEKRGMPTELALLPMVESSYNPTAYSRSHASGLWQFIPSTGKQYKLEQNWWLDARRDIVASTAAALEYLQYIYEMHGDWHLALASYNWGEGAVGRAVSKNAAQGLPTDYMNLKMPDETRHYVPKLQALKNIFSNPNILASLNLRGVPNRPYFATVTKTANIDVKLAAELAGMSVKEFIALNPAHNRPVIRSETPMVIPADRVDRFISNLEAHEESEKPLSNWQAYTLRAGERLEDVAPRFGMTVANLRAVNGISGRIRITAGQTLLVATQEGTGDANEGMVMSEAEPAITTLPPRIVAEQPPRLPLIDSAPVQSTRSHVVNEGETLPEIAQRNGLAVAEFRKINSLNADRVSPGTKTVVATTEASSKTVPPTVSPSSLAVAETRTLYARPETVQKGRMRTHVVAKGETLGQIAQRYGLTIAELRQINKLRAEQVNVGARLTIAVAEVANTPVATASIVKPKVILSEAEPKAATAHNSNPSPASPRLHIVAKGETLFSVAQRYHLSVAELKQINGLRTEQVNAGTRLTLAAADIQPSLVKETKAEGSKNIKSEAKSVRKVDAANAGRPAGKKPVRLAQYTIRRGDTLASIAKQFNVEKDDLLRWNHAQVSDLKAGQTLTIQLVQSTY